MKQTSRALFVASVIAVATLTACGGGGGGGGSDAITPVIAPTVSPEAVISPSGNSVTVPATPPANAYAASTIVNMQAPLSSYGAASEELKVFNRLNADRMNCGFGTVRQNINLDAASFNHLNWTLVNNYQIGHYEDLKFSSGVNAGQLTVGFTGNSLAERAKYAGYQFEFVSEVLSSMTLPGYYGVGMLKNLYAAPYHAAGLFSRARDVGVSNTVAGDRTSILEVTLGYIASEGPQLLASDSVATFPCQGTQDTAISLTNESPNPVPERDLSVQPIGQPIFITARQGNIIVISSASVTQVSNSLSIKLLPTLTNSNDAAAHLFKNEAFVMPDAPLAKNTQYQVNISGTNNAVPFTKSFTFTTGAT